ncbi:hypothetical protein [Ilumatobacter sp.]|uniref:hypothetical protein n=1 Tax=Ilumatobacter sp. TaxID=1967498 RepID=UPI0037538091
MILAFCLAVGVGASLGAIGRIRHHRLMTFSGTALCLAALVLALLSSTQFPTIIGVAMACISVPLGVIVARLRTQTNPRHGSAG